jgi:3-hydroxyacyl-CoA dehydrogenase
MFATWPRREGFGLAFDVVDDLTGDKLGRAKSGTFRTADLVGLDTIGHVMKTMQDNLKDDPFAASYRDAAGRAEGADRQGRARVQKTGAGFYRKDGKAVLRFDPDKGDYVPAGAKADETVVRILKKKDPGPNASSCCAVRPIRRRSSSGRCCAIPSTTPR